jgi:gluconate 2-dehydrogenase gamma chain
VPPRHRALVGRRTFIAASAAAAASTGLSGCSWHRPAPALSRQEFQLVEALADQIIPPDDTPGGRDADVAVFIERQLAGPYRRFHAAYRDGLAKIDATSRRLHQRDFVGLDAGAQTALLESLERDAAPDGIWEPRGASRFFQMLCDHCMQGFYGSPRHGGNRNFASWRMIGLDHPQVLGRVITP